MAPRSGKTIDVRFAVPPSARVPNIMSDLVVSVTDSGTRGANQTVTANYVPAAAAPSTGNLG